MSIINYDRLYEIVSYLKGKINTTRCVVSGELLRVYLSKIADDTSTNNCHKYISPHWVYHEYTPNGTSFSEMYNEIEGFLTKYGFLRIAIYQKDYEKSNRLGHLFIVCNTDKGQVICDSYINVRGLEIQPFNLKEILTSVRSNMTIDKWNQIWHCNLWGSISLSLSSSINYEFDIEVAYHDITKEYSLYRDGVRLHDVPLSIVDKYLHEQYKKENIQDKEVSFLPDLLNILIQ